MAYVLQQFCRPNRCSCRALPEGASEFTNQIQRAQHLQHPGLQQRHEQQQQQQLGLRLTPGRKYVQLWKSKRPRRKRRLLDAPTDPDHPWWGITKAERRQALQQEREAQYGPHAADRDVRLYLKRRELNAAQVRPSRRGGFPLDDSFDQPGTFLKLSSDFQRTVLLERVQELVSTLPQLSPEAAWQLYTTTPGLLTYTTLQVAQRLTGLSAALGTNTAHTLHYLCTYRPLAFLQPDTVRSRVGVCARVSRLDVSAAVRLMQQHPDLWRMSSRRLGPRVEALSLMLHCCTVTSLRLLGSCSPLLTTPLDSLQQQLSALCSLMGCAGQPQQVVPLLLWRPSLLLDQQAKDLEPWQESMSVLSQQQQQQPVAVLSQQQQQQQRVLAPGSTTDAQQSAQLLFGPTTIQQQQQQRGRRQVIQQQGLGGAAVAAVQQQLQDLSTGLGLSLQQVQDMVVRAPELLALAAGGPDCITAACAALSSSWLLAPHEEAVQRRQVYQQELLQALQPQQYSSTLRRRKVRQGLEGTGPCWHDAAQAVDVAVIRCQWWAAGGQQQQQQGGSGQVSALQQLLLQAPALLVLASGPGLGAQQADGLGQDVLSSSYLSQSTTGAAAGSSEDVLDSNGDVLGDRLQELCVHLLALFEQQQQQQQQQQAEQQQQQQQELKLKFATGQSAGPSHTVQQQPGATPPDQQPTVHLHQQRQLASVIKQAAVLEPCLLTQPPGWVAGQVLQLSKALQVPMDSMWALVVQHPAILWLTQAQLFERIRVLCGVLKLPAHDVKHLVAGADAVQLLLVHPEAVKRGFVSAATKVAASENSVRRALLKQPAALLPGRTRVLVSHLKRM